MKHNVRLLVISTLIALLSLLMTPTFAQEEGDIPGPGEGDPVIRANLGQDIATLNPILSSDGSSQAVIAHILPTLIGASPDTLNWEIGVAGTLATDLDISEDGLVYTFTLRDDWSWSDGTPITAQDYKYAYDAIASGETDTSLTYVLDDIASVEAPDDYTLVLTLNQASCAAFENIAAVPVVPSHIYQEWFPTFADMNESPRNLGPQPATAGPWQFRNFRPGEQVTLSADENYPDAYAGYVIPEGWVYRNVATTDLIIEEFLLGNLSAMGTGDPDSKDRLRELGAEGEVQVYEDCCGNMRFIAFNLADPTNPQPAFDEEGNPIDQGHHPLTGDVRVRQAIQYGINFDAMNEGVFGGEAINVASHVLPTSWAYDPDLEPYTYDPDQAMALLDEAGFTDEDGDGIRECHGCLYAEEGTPLSLEFITNAGNVENENLGVLLQDQWGELGIDIDFQAVDFNLLVDRLTAQDYDLVLIFWGFGFPDDPNGIRVVFDPSNDVPGGGFNTSSYNNERVNELMDMANDPAQTNGCDLQTRFDLYQEVLQTLKEDSPWVWLNVTRIVDAAQPYLENWDPRPGIGQYWNEDAWIIDRTGFEAGQ
jgi:peptide/nickel transport system substrate-binding protein